VIDADAEVIITIEVEPVPASRADEVETAAMEALARLGLSCGVDRRRQAHADGVAGAPQDPRADAVAR
jgi:hypothetical protein